jgi:hypothetical protein
MKIGGKQRAMARVSGLALAASLLSGACVTTPHNGDNLASTSSSVSLQGYGLGPSRPIGVEAATAASGPYVAVPGGTTTTSSTGSPIPYGPNGSQTVYLYAFSVAAVIPAPRWHTVPGCATNETFVRIHDNSYAYTTFDAGDWSACLQAHGQLGDDTISAIYACHSARSPVLRLTQGASVHVGDVVIDDPSDIAALACVETIQGSLTVTGSAPHAVSLPNLHHVTGDVTLTYTSYENGPPHNVTRCGNSWTALADLRTFDLGSLEIVEGNLTLTQEGQFSGGPSTQPIEFGLNGLATVGGSVSLTVQQFGGSPCGLGGLTFVPGDVTLHFLSSGDVSNDVNLLLPAVQEVGGTLTIRGAYNVSGSPFGKLWRAGGLHIIRPFQNYGWRLPALTTVTGTVELEGVNLVDTPSGLKSAGSLVLTGTGLHSLQDVGGSDLSVGSLVLQDNGVLSSLLTAGASKVTLAAAGSMTFSGNTSLLGSEICAFVAFQRAHGFSGSVSIGSATCP